MSERNRSPLLLVAFLVLVAVALSACGGGASDGEAAASDTAPSDDDAFAECMRENGVDFPEGQFQTGVGVTPDEAPSETIPSSPPSQVGRGPSDSIDRDVFEAAQDACEELLPEGAVMFGGPRGPGDAGVDASAFRAYTSCMADHGVELPEPGETGGPPASVDRDDPDFAAAQEVCAALLPNVTETPPPTSTPSTTAA